MNALQELRADAESFLYREARLLDTQRFEDWLDLFTDDATYWVPAGRDDIDPARHVSIIHDDKAAMARRVKRLRSGFAFAQEPASRLHRIVSNVDIVDADADGGSCEVHCMMLLVELARHRQTMHSAHCEFTLTGSRPQWRIRRKKVNLLRNGEALECISYLL
ncbi:MAG: aromatic-ring-hydroxylating dioxygenase subunit beta [Pigmentiphaga sp.]|uniref:aromatic-ring-hydroxylating dioxygenase subunit beta n=1 Tax=Pigmentiphaga sp. TaxID=1977564 RepID=UPI0029B87BDE|nr:aromatic-ring-hydroxylating dioxygenase subunit beta [Pigmentiphaga sp.]MDX3906226.1 aromatic-ring-hydroxylating dioxygenase subunit beta [Pigmentiphaga sp.]